MNDELEKTCQETTVAYFETTSEYWLAGTEAYNGNSYCSLSSDIWTPDLHYTKHVLQLRVNSSASWAGYPEFKSQPEVQYSSFPTTLILELCRKESHCRFMPHSLKFIIHTLLYGSMLHKLISNYIFYIHASKKLSNNFSRWILQEHSSPNA